MEKNLFLILISCIGLTSCNTTSAISLSNNSETLMISNYKVIENGYFTFLVFENEHEVNEIIYHYSINIRNSKATCSKHSEKVYNIQEKMKNLKNCRFQTAKEFKHSQANTWREKYYNCFAGNFLDITNDEKIDLLNKLSKK